MYRECVQNLVKSIKLITPPNCVGLLYLNLEGMDTFFYCILSCGSFFTSVRQFLMETFLGKKLLRFKTEINFHGNKFLRIFQKTAKVSSANTFFVLKCLQIFLKFLQDLKVTEIDFQLFPSGCLQSW